MKLWCQRHSFWDCFKTQDLHTEKQRLPVDESQDEQARVISMVLDTILKVAGIGYIA